MATQSLWFQLYMIRDRGLTREIVERAEATGCKAICITVDTPVTGARNREQRAGRRRGQRSGARALPPHLTGYKRPQSVEGAIYSTTLDPTITWKEINWVRSFARVPVLIKGVLNPADAQRRHDRPSHSLRTGIGQTGGSQAGHRDSAPRVGDGHGPDGKDLALPDRPLGFVANLREVVGRTDMQHERRNVEVSAPPRCRDTEKTGRAYRHCSGRSMSGLLVGWLVPVEPLIRAAARAPVSAPR